MSAVQDEIRRLMDMQHGLMAPLMWPECTRGTCGECDAIYAQREELLAAQAWLLPLALAQIRYMEVQARFLTDESVPGELGEVCAALELALAAAEAALGGTK